MQRDSAIIKTRRARQLVVHELDLEMDRLPLRLCSGSLRLLDALLQIGNLLATQRRLCLKCGIRLLRVLLNQFYVRLQLTERYLRLVPVFRGLLTQNG